MPRRREVPQRTILPDPKFGDGTLAKFMNVLMLDGKKSVAERMVYGALDAVANRTKEDPLEVFQPGARQRATGGRGQIASCRWCYLPSPR